MLRKILSGLLVLILFLTITGCKKSSSTELTTGTTKTTEYSDVITKAKELIAVDIAPEFVVNTKSLFTYSNINDPGISYVNIIEFIHFLDGALVELEINKSEVMTITYTFDVPLEYQEIYGGETYTYEMIIDPSSDTIKFNDFDMVTNINGDTLTQYETDLTFSNIEYIGGDLEVEIDLAKYGFDIVHFNNEYYIPLYLANLFFTGAYVNVYEMNNQIYIFDNFTDLSELTSKFKSSSIVNPSILIEHTKKYMILYFDYFYGLKIYKNVDSYKNIISNYNFDKIESYNSLSKEIEKFIINQNDLHTSLVSAGFRNKDYISSNLQSNKMSNYIQAYIKNRCQERTNEISMNMINQNIIIEVNGFSLETRENLKMAMEEATKYENIYIDVSCNPGGNLIGAIELLSYMTNDEIKIRTINPQVKALTIESYQPANNALVNKKFYIKTSAATYSAANLFVSIVKDHKLGTIIGEKSGGGASSITYTVLPYGAIIVNSSNYTLINDVGDVIEDGITVDVEFNSPEWHDIITYFN